MLSTETFFSIVSGNFLFACCRYEERAAADSLSDIQNDHLRALIRSDRMSGVVLHHRTTVVRLACSVAWGRNSHRESNALQSAAVTKL
jgi:hypothetical protein